MIGDSVFIGTGRDDFWEDRLGIGWRLGDLVVSEDVPDGMVVSGIPAKIVSDAGSEGYVNRTDY